ncbi:FtsK/SpoIIIE domain-containing protein [Sinomonas sp. P47F7]|uniref:FtsK/SpoIIIE domain-containing protein n=1 Tax=Sinomonas sp. P47F7 TaxID=3410987 RepID=UPI003BF51D67
MELHFTLVAPECGDHAVRELVATVQRGTSGADIASELFRLFEATGIEVEGRALAGLTVGSPPLRSGALLLAGSARGPANAPRAPLVFAVRSGPAAGSVFGLERGVSTVGRGPDGRGLDGKFDGGPVRRLEGRRDVIALPDPELSREHARFDVGESSVRLVDAGSRNGTTLDGRRVREALVTRGQRIRFGSTTGSLEVSGGSRPHAGAGRLHGDPLRVTRPVGGRPRLALLAMAVVPLVLGVGIAAFTGQWMFLALSGVSAGSALLPLVEGRKARRAFGKALARAVDDDLARRLQAAPDAYEISTQEGAATPESGALQGPVMLRVGEGRQRADVVVDPDDGAPIPEHPSAPIVVPLEGLVAVRGPHRAVEGHASFLVLQLASLPAASGLRVVVAGGSRPFRLAARFLPRVRVLSDEECGDPARARHAFGAGERCCLLLLPKLRQAVVSDVVTAALAVGLPVIDAAGTQVGARAEIDVGRTPARLRARGKDTDFIADLVPTRAFAAAARHLCAVGETDDGGTLPGRCSLDSVVGLGEGDLAEAWTRADVAAAASVPVALGQGHAGPLTIDLVADGPHLLIAGTTGSGKSELLRSLIASAAASHSPRRITFLFVDFKGGSGLEPLARLPHCVGLVSDLVGEINRTLISLRAEVVRRERILADAGCADIADYQRLSDQSLSDQSLSGGHEPLARLVLVIDEFRMLVEENPEALTEFLRIASIGRSLGLHLVMATQRPQGAVSADIRANVGSVIALRVAGESESRDAIGSPAAARIPAGVPGRALLVAGASEPVEFQTASLGLAGERAARQPVRIVSADDWLTAGSRGREDSLSLTPAEAAAGFVEAAREAWRAAGGDPPRRPVAEPLPDSAGAPEPARGGSVPLGVADLPHEQRTAVLCWSPEREGHLVFVGDAASGSDRALTAVVGQLAVAGLRRSLYLLDADGSFSGLQSHPRVGAYVRADEPRLAARVISRLAQEAARRAGGEGPAAERPTLVLAISGWGNWIATLRSGAYSGAEDALLELARSGPARHVVLAVSGSRELVASRAFAELPSRLFFPWGTTEEARLGWPRMIGPAATARPAATDGAVSAGRAIAAGLISHERPVAVQCFDAPPAQQRPPVEPGSPPFRILPLPTEVSSAEVSRAVLEALSMDTQAASSTPGAGWLAVGVHGDEARPLALPLAPGNVLLVLGPRGSGKTSLLDALPAMNPGSATWHRPDRTGSAHASPPEAGSLAASPPEAGSLAASAAAAARDARAGRRAILLVDDADRLSQKENSLVVEALDAGASVVATAGYGTAPYSACPIALRARTTRSGIAIRPRSPSDGDAFGVRLDPPCGTARGGVPPGRGVVVVDGTQVDVQLGWLGPGRPRAVASSQTTSSRPSEASSSAA